MLYISLGQKEQCLYLTHDCTTQVTVLENKILVQKYFIYTVWRRAPNICFSNTICDSLHYPLLLGVPVSTQTPNTKRITIHIAIYGSITICFNIILFSYYIIEIRHCTPYICRHKIKYIYIYRYWVLNVNINGLLYRLYTCMRYLWLYLYAVMPGYDPMKNTHTYRTPA